MLKTKIGRHALTLAVVLGLVVAPSVWANEALDQGMTHFKSGKYAEAAAEFQNLVDGAPNYDFGYFMLGLSMMKMGKSKDAENNIVKAIELNGDKFDFHYNLANAYRIQKKYDKVVKTLNNSEGLPAMFVPIVTAQNANWSHGSK